MRRRPLTRSSRRRSAPRARGALRERRRRRRRLPGAQRGGPPLRPLRGLPDSARPLPLPAPRRRASASSTQGPRWRAAKPAPTTCDLTAPRRARARPAGPAPPRRRAAAHVATPCRSRAGGRAATGAPPGGAGGERAGLPRPLPSPSPRVGTGGALRAGDTVCRREAAAAREQVRSARPLGLRAKAPDEGARGCVGRPCLLLVGARVPCKPEAARAAAGTLAHLGL